MADNSQSGGNEESMLLESAGLGWVQNLRLDVSPCSSGRSLIASDHAVQRYRERVEHLPEPLARRHLAQLCAEATFSSQPPPWCDIHPVPGTCFGTVASQPDVCLVALGRVVITVITRQSAALARELRLCFDGTDGI